MPERRRAAADDYRRVHLTVKWKPADMWLGLYWEHDVQGWDGGWWEGWHFWLCLLPCLPVHLEVDRSNRDTREYRRWRKAVSGRASA